MSTSTLKAPVKVAAKDVRSFKEKAEKRIVDALDKAVLEAMKEIKTDSLAIHTTEERKKTDTVCAAYLTGAASCRPMTPQEPQITAHFQAFPPGWKPDSTAGEDARRYNCSLRC